MDPLHGFPYAHPHVTHRPYFIRASRAPLRVKTRLTGCRDGGPRAHPTRYLPPIDAEFLGICDGTRMVKLLRIALICALVSMRPAVLVILSM